MHKLLMVDDDIKNLKATQTFLKLSGYEVVTTTSPDEALKFVKNDEFALALIDYQMPAMMGDVLAEMIKKVSPNQQVAMYSSDLSREAVKAGMKAGALDFIEKTMPPNEFLTVVGSYCNKYDNLWRTVRVPKEKSEIRKLIEAAGMIGQSSSMAEIVINIKKVAPADASVLIRGESGTGKELVAKAIHDLSPRSKKGKFVAVNCAAIPKDLLESELFGHLKGSFSGAVADKVGKFELADNGTLFLDELGDMPLDLQVKLLRALQEREIMPVGGKFPKKINVRIVAATNKNIEEMAARELFREDLIYRIRVIEIEIPPLRDRVEDIEPLVEHFTEFFNKKNGKNKHFQKSTIEVLKKNPWGGNIRELQGCIERHIITCQEDIIRPDSLDLKFYESTPVVSADLTLEQFRKNQTGDEIRFVKNAVEQAGGKKVEAARRLGIKPTHLQYLLNGAKAEKLDETPAPEIS